MTTSKLMDFFRYLRCSLLHGRPLHTRVSPKLALWRCPVCNVHNYYEW